MSNQGIFLLGAIDVKTRLTAVLLLALAVTAAARRPKGAVSEGRAQAAERGPGGEAGLVPPDLDS